MHTDLSIAQELRAATDKAIAATKEAAAVHQRLTHARHSPPLFTRALDALDLQLTGDRARESRYNIGSAK